MGWKQEEYVYLFLSHQVNPARQLALNGAQNKQAGNL